MIYKSPKATVGCILYHPEKGKSVILLTKRNIEPFKNYWCFPGGHIEENEDTKSAITREVKEETNLDIEPVFFKYSDEIFPEKDIHHVALFFYGKAQGKIKKDEVEVAQIDWFLIDEALKMDLAFNHRAILLEYKSLHKIK